MKHSETRLMLVALARDVRLPEDGADVLCVCEAEGVR